MRCQGSAANAFLVYCPENMVTAISAPPNPYMEWIRGYFEAGDRGKREGSGGGRRKRLQGTKRREREMNFWVRP